MHNASDFGYSTSVVSMKCVACGDSKSVWCCDGNGNRNTHIVHDQENGYVEAFASEADAKDYAENIPFLVVYTYEEWVGK